MRVIVGASIHTMAEPAHADSIAWDKGRIVAVGRRDEVLKIAGPGAEVEALGECAITPGFIDAHHHMSIALLFSCAPNIGPTRAKNHDEIRALLAAHAATLAPGAWVVAYGFDEWQLAEKRAPSREFLDAACPEHPVFLIHYSYHEGVANSRALELAGIDRKSQNPTGGVIERAAFRGELTGRLIETAMQPVEERARRALTTRYDEEFIEKIDDYERSLTSKRSTGEHSKTTRSGSRS